MNITPHQLLFGLHSLGVSNAAIQTVMSLPNFIEPNLNLNDWMDIFQKEFDPKDLKKIHLSELQSAVQEWEFLKSNGIEPLYPQHPYYPKILLDRQLERKLNVLYANGPLPLLNKDSVAIVGSRYLSEQGIQIAKQFAEIAVNQQYQVVSGYAKGVDTFAHLTAMKKGGSTIAVLASGFGEFRLKTELKPIYNGENFIAISQFPYSERWRGRNAMIRNATVVALSKAVIVIESGAERNEEGKTSGTFDCAKTALKMGVTLYIAAPEIVSKNAVGNEELIKRGGIAVDPNLLEQYLRPPPIENPQEVHQEEIKNQSGEQLSLFNNQ